MSAAVGRATVTGNAGEGLYTIDLDYGSAEIARRVARLQGAADELDTSIQELADKLAELDDERGPIVAALNDAIALYADYKRQQMELEISAPPEPDESWQVMKRELDEMVDRYQTEVVELTGSLAETQGQFELAQRDLANARLQRSNILARVADLQALSTTETRQAWCADYTEDATGEVATVEINGEQPGIIIAPGAPGASAADGAMTHRMAMSPAATYANAALLPGWQRWSPTYRVGEITALSGDLCTVQLDEAASSAQGLGINPTQTLEAVPIEYMECNGDAFELGDRVVVMLEGQSWANPKVVGFESNPRPCGVDIWVTSGFKAPSGYLYQVTSRVRRNLSSVVESWVYSAPIAPSQIGGIAAISNSEAVSVAYEYRQTETPRPVVIDATSGAAVFTPIDDPQVSSAQGVGFDRDERALIVGGGRGSDKYSYPYWSHLLVAPDPPGAQANSLGVFGGKMLRALRGEDGSDSLYAVMYDTADFSLLWSTAVAFGTVDNPVYPGDVATSADYAAVLVDTIGIGYSVAVLNPETGSVIRNIPLGPPPSSPGGMSPRGVTIRDQNLYILYYTPSWVNDYTYPKHKVMMLDILTGSPASPTAELDNVLGEHVPADYTNQSNLGSID